MEGRYSASRVEYLMRRRGVSETLLEVLVGGYWASCGTKGRVCVSSLLISNGEGVEADLSSEGPGHGETSYTNFQRTQKRTREFYGQG